jgi:tRNA(Ile)-lysidine synthase
VQINLPSGDNVTAFTHAIERLTGERGRSLLLAVSGGPDSLALLLLARTAFPDHIRAATVDHGLRPEATQEAVFVERLCGDLDISHAILRPDTPISGSLQSSARRARYDLLERHAKAHGCHWIATAHHADDQLETVLMRVARGSGIDGLSAIREQQGKIIRPLLGFSKAELEALCHEAGVTPVRDPSNDDAQFDRVAMRQWLARSDHPFDPKRAVRTAAAFADAAEALEWATDTAYAAHAVAYGHTITLNPAGLPNELRRRLLLRALAHIEPENTPRGDAVDRALADLASGKRFTLGNVLCEGGKAWAFRPAPTRRQ